MSDKCELCEVRDQEVKRLVRGLRSTEELIDSQRAAIEKLQAELREARQDLQVMLGRMGRSASFAEAQIEAGVDVIVDGSWLPPPLIHPRRVSIMAKWLPRLFKKKPPEGPV